MHGLKVPKEEGEKVRQTLVKRGLLLPHYKIKRDDTSLYFPVKEGIPGYDLVDCVFEERKSHPESVKKFGMSSFDIIGDIAVVDIPDDMEDKKMEIAETLLQRKPIHTVVEKVSKVQGEYRVRAFNHLLGEKKTETIHTEYGLKFHVNIDTVYFNPRLSTERMRIAQEIQPGELITDMFCGIGPFSLMISRYSQAEKIYAIDINPEAITLLKENIALNNIKNVIPVLGDAKEEVPLIGHVDRIIMNLPHNTLEFLPLALQYGDVIYYYTITSDIQGEIDRMVALDAPPFNICGYRAVKSYSPDMEMYRIDIETPFT